MKKRKQAGLKLRGTGWRLAAAAAVVAVVAVGVAVLRPSPAVAPYNDGPVQPAAEPVVASIKYGNGTGRGGLQPHGMGLAPYAFIPYGNVVMGDYAKATGVKNFFAAFVLGSDCMPLWDGQQTLGMASRRSVQILADINTVRAEGGEVAVSFGGFAGTELANTCADVTELQAAYQRVVDEYGINHINFDLEHAGLTDKAAMARRVQAVAELQRANPTLKVSLTFQATPGGLTDDSLKALRLFGEGGVVVSNVNVMAMNFGSKLPGAQSGRVISAAQGTVKQLQAVYPEAAKQQLWQTLGITVMVGRNDTPETFTPDDARAVHDFAVRNNVGTLSYWSANRDQQCPDSSTMAIATCSGVEQSKYQFAELLKRQ